ncbi:Hypothetical protein HVR_LOCUS1057 [uncultured virus]|nr:Hypothetical protein HVR_LOCUS1057 [uncultured virus]
MDIVNDATRSSSSSENTISDVSKESSSPFDTTTQTEQNFVPEINQEMAQLTTSDNGVQSSDSRVITITDFNGTYLDTSAVVRPLRRKFQGMKERKENLFREKKEKPIRERKENPMREKKERKERLMKEPKEKKIPEIVPSLQKFHLRLVLMSEQMFTRQKSGLIINRLKGKISGNEFGVMYTFLGAKMALLTSALNEFVVSRHQELSTGYVSQDTIDAVTKLFVGISLKEKTPVQQNKLRQKIVNNLANSGIRLSIVDPHANLKQELLALSPAERASVLRGIPL